MLYRQDFSRSLLETTGMGNSWISSLRTLAFAAVLSFPVMYPAAAQEVPESEDPPDRAARLSYRMGEVSLEEAGSTERTVALLNRPLTTGDRLWADQQGRAELQVGSATLRIDEYTGIELKELGNDSLHVALDEGVLTVHVRDVGRDETLSIETPNALVSLHEPGEYSIEVNQSGDTTVVKVRDGASTVASREQDSREYHVDAGRQGIFTGRDRLSAAIDEADRRTAFEDWSGEREDRATRSASARYVSPEVIGYEDLDDHGDWHSHAEYGHVWYPRSVAVGWAPYRYGHWSWVGPWGWTWIDNAPWGFAPFHYGRWAYIGSHWGWVPGPRYIRPVYAPALVAWVGGPSVSVSMSFGRGIGWFPLGPREVYVPGYRASRRHIHNVNVANTTIVNNTYITNVYASRGRNERYAHQDRGNAVTAVSRDDFTRGRPVDRHQIRWNDRERGGVEVNNLPPERSAGGPDSRRSAGGVSRGSVPGDVSAITDSRRNDRAGRMPGEGRPNDRTASRARGSGSELDTESGAIGRPYIGRPSPSTDKQYRGRQTTELERNRESYRQDASPPTERVERVERGERRVVGSEPRRERSVEGVRGTQPGRITSSSFGETRGRTPEPYRAPARAAPQSSKELQRGQRVGGDGGASFQQRGGNSGASIQQRGSEGGAKALPRGGMSSQQNQEQRASGKGQR